MMPTLAELIPAASNAQILTVLIGGAALCSIAYLLLGLATKWREFRDPNPPVKVHPVETEFVKRGKVEELEREIRGNAKELSALITKNFGVLQLSMHQQTLDLNAAGERRASKIHERINEVTERIARVEERTKRL